MMFPQKEQRTLLELERSITPMNILVVVELFGSGSVYYRARQGVPCLAPSLVLALLAGKAPLYPCPSAAL